LNPFSYLTPKSLDSAVREFMSRENACLLAGGTDLLPLLKYGIRNPSCLLDLGRVQELRDLALKEDGLFIGSMVSLSEVTANPIIQQHFPVLAASARCVASPQIRNQGTIGGNLLQERRCHYFNQSESWRKGIAPCFQLEGNVCHQVPGSEVCRALYYSDLAPALLAFDASAEVYNREGAKTVLLRDLIHSHVTGKREKLLLKGIRIPVSPTATWGKFSKQSVRSAIDFALVNVALRYSPNGEEGPCARIFVGAMSPEPFPLEKTAQYLSRPLESIEKEGILEMAMNEAGSKLALVRETAVSAKTKRQSLQILGRILEEWFAVWAPLR
jgi:4-hydroxybenzoyl-CoA reductase subunit beta